MSTFDKGLLTSASFFGKFRVCNRSITQVNRIIITKKYLVKRPIESLTRIYLKV